MNMRQEIVKVIARAAIIFAVWVVGCFVADYALPIDLAKAYIMLWGLVVGSVSFYTADRIVGE